MNFEYGFYFILLCIQWPSPSPLILLLFNLGSSNFALTTKVYFLCNKIQFVAKNGERARFWLRILNGMGSQVIPHFKGLFITNTLVKKVLLTSSRDI